MNGDIKKEEMNSYFVPEKKRFFIWKIKDNHEFNLRIITISGKCF
jgi:hypothetical protein